MTIEHPRPIDLDLISAPGAPGDGAGSGAGPAAGPPSTPPEAAADLLDAYSRAVMAVVEGVGPSVVSVGALHRGTARTGDGRRIPFEAPASGSGVIIAPDG